MTVGLATWMLEHLTFGRDNESLCGDLLEELREGRSAGWYFRQASMAIGISVCETIREYASPLVFSAGWSTLYPLWRFIGRMSNSRARANSRSCRTWLSTVWRPSSVDTRAYKAAFTDGSGRRDAMRNCATNGHFCPLSFRSTEQAQYRVFYGPTTRPFLAQ
jgi:hypothetical protein